MPDIAVNGPLVTVVTVTYNSAAYVRDAIESVLAQTYTHIEYIIGDDCSADNTWEIISGYRDKRIKAYRNEKNLGEYPNRNKAIAMASGKYLLFIDGDDVILPHGLGYFVSQIEALPAAVMLVQKGYYNNIIFPVLLQPEEAVTNRFFGKNNLLSSSFSSNLFLTDLLQKETLADGYISGDEEIRLRLAVKYPVLFVAGWVSWPRETPGQASSKIRRERALLEELKYSEAMLRDPESKIGNELAEKIGRLLKYQIARHAIYLFSRGRFIIALSFLEAAGLKLWSLLNYRSYATDVTDVFTGHDPANPFKREFQQLIKK